MNALFVDTGVWVAYINAADALHIRAVELIVQPTLPVVTTWPIVWETVTLLSRRVNARTAVEVGMQFVSGELAELLELTTTDYALAWEFMLRFADRRLSAADATACAIVRRLNVGMVAAFDRDFQLLLPERLILGVQ